MAKKTGFKVPKEVKDERFSSMHSKPTFQRMRTDKHKVALDPRFGAVLKDERFQVPASKYDKYGRKQKPSTAKDELSAFYTLEEESGARDVAHDRGDSDDESVETDDDDLAEAEAEIEAAKESSATGRKLKPKPMKLKRQKFKPGEKLPADEMERRLGFLNRMARGELESGESESDSEDSDSSDSSDESSDEGGKETALVAAKKLATSNIEDLPKGGETARLAVCNLDWVGAISIFHETHEKAWG